MGLSELVDGERNPAGPADVRPAMRSRRIVAPAFVLLLAGCAVQTIPTPGPVSPLSLPTIGPGARDCGTLVLRQGQEVPADAARCVIEAVEARQPARLIVTSPTDEGDPITTSYTVAVDGRVEVTTDSRADRYGAGNVERRTCTEPTVQKGGWLSFATCSPPEVSTATAGTGPDQRPPRPPLAGGSGR